MRYLKEENTLNIPEDFEQAFCKDPALNTDLTQIMLLKHRGIIDKTDIKILEFVYEMKFVTVQQMERFAAFEGVEKDDLEARLSVMYSNSIINKFGFVEEEKYRGKLPADIKLFYCLHTGGKQLLDNFGADDYYDWVVGYNITSPKGVSKTIIASELYLQLYTSNVPFVSHTRRPSYTIKEKSFCGGEEFCMMVNNTPTYYISEVFFASDKQNIVKQKLRNYEGVFSSKGWMRYYKDGNEVPTLLFITEDDDTASQLAGLINEFYRFTGTYLLTTKERILQGITTEGSFLYHDRDINKLKATCLEKLL